jgi:glutathione S-transferase
MQYVELVAVLAVLQFFAFGALTGRARSQSGLKAPAMTGHEGFERMYRVQMNTLAPWMAGIGAVYLIGRHLYWRAYVTDPAKRGLGFMLTMLPTLLLLIMALLGIVLSLTGLRA